MVDYGGYQRPYEVVAAALEAWKADDSRRAESLFRDGVEAYRRTEPDGVDYALGRYGAFLRKLGRNDDAERVLEEAIRAGTDLPAIWDDYLRLLADRRDIDRLFASASQLPATVISQAERHEVLLAHARRSIREGDFGFAEQVARTVLESAMAAGDRTARWAAVGVYGQVLEKEGRVRDAATLWKEAFDEGSDDSVTATRYTMYLERAKEYEAALRTISTALTRGLPANVEEQLRKRLARCEAKQDPSRRRRSNIEAFSVRRGEDVFRLAFQSRVKPPIKDLEIVAGVARCLGSSKGISALVDLDLSSGKELRRVEGLPNLHDTEFAPDGWGIGIERTARVGGGPTNLVFLDPEGVVAARSDVPDATSQLAFGGGQWYVGCRDGRLYAFTVDGSRRWAWETPGSRTSVDNAYFRPCPYHVACGEEFAVVSSMGTLFGIDPSGHTLWELELPNERETAYTVTVPLGGELGPLPPYEVLGIPSSAALPEVKSAYRRLALATHPDRNPEEPEAVARFREVQSAYEAILAGQLRAPAPSVNVSVQLFGMAPIVSFLAANEDGVVAGSSQGRLYLIEPSGRVNQVRVLGEGQVRAALRNDGALAVAWCDGAVSFFEGTAVVNAIESPEYPHGLTVFGEDVLLWRSREVQILDRLGRELWRAEFSKRLTDVAALGRRVVCAAGVLAAFERDSVDGQLSSLSFLDAGSIPPTGRRG